MTMTNEEIVRDYKLAKAPSKQIKILAELNQCDRKKIIQILTDAGCKLPGNCVPNKTPKTKSHGVPLAAPEKKPESVEEKKPVQLPGAKNDDGKLQLSKVPPELITAVATIRAYGIAKYAEAEDWTKVDPERFHEAMLRHALAVWENPKAVDPESGYPSLWHLATNAAFLIAMEGKHHG